MPDRMRCIIMADGKGTRWEGEPPKHLVEIEGETLLHRTVRLLRANGCGDIWVLGPDDRYDVPGTVRFQRPRSEDLEIDKFLSARELWGGRVTHFYGDVYYTPLAMQTIVTHPGGPHVFFGRRRSSRITGTRHGEMFAASFTDLAALRSACERIRAERQAGTLARGGSWELYQVLQGKPMNPYGRQSFDKRWVEIDDWTEDFDSRAELAEWLRRRARAGAKR